MIPPLEKRKGRPVVQLELDDSDRTELERRIRSHTIAAKDRLRARIVLRKSQGKTQEEISQALQISRRTVMKWANRYTEDGLKGLKDEPGRGRSE
jgi:DNA-directed RNA polymerase specialized sigma24 family protein